MRGIYLILIMLSMSCRSANQHIGRAIAKDPTLIQYKPIRLDTMVVTFAPSIDTSISITPDAPITIEEDGLVVTIKEEDDGQLSVSAECPTDTVYINRVEYVPQIEYHEPPFKMMDVLYAFGGLVAISLIVSIVRR